MTRDNKKNRSDNYDENIHQRRQGHTLGETFPVVYLIERSEIKTFFSLVEICSFSMTETVRHYAKQYGIANRDFVCRITGIRDCAQFGWHEFMVRRGGYMEYTHINNKFTIKSDQL